MEPWERLAAVARRQHLVVTRGQASCAGVSVDALERRVRGEGWARLHRGVYALPGAPRTPQLDAAAALLAVGQPAALTGEIAALLHGMRDVRPTRIEVAVPHLRRVAPGAGIVVRRSRHFAARRQQSVDGLRVVVPPAAAGDLGLTVGHHALVRAIARGVSLRLLLLDHLDEELALRAGAPGAPALRRALADLRGELSHSDSEHVMRRRLAAAGVGLHPEPYKLRDEHGMTVAEIDLAVVAVRHGIEVDGPHHLLPEQIARDKRRDRAAGRCGWTIDRYPVDEVEEDPDRVVREVLARLRGLGRRR